MNICRVYLYCKLQVSHSLLNSKVSILMLLHSLILTLMYKSVTFELKVTQLVSSNMLSDYFE